MADVGQTPPRGGTTLAGDAPTITTSSHWYAFHNRDFVEPPKYFAIHGFDDSAIDFGGLSHQEIIKLAGRGMATTSIAIGLTPILYALGYLTKTSTAGSWE